MKRDDQNDLPYGYHMQRKIWIKDPDSIPSETFVTHHVASESGSGEISEQFQDATQWTPVELKTKGTID